MNFKCGGFQDTVIDGVGPSLCIFFQGCNKKCNDCSNPMLQDQNAGNLYDTTTIINNIHNHSDFYKSAVYVGGEPCLQANSLYSIASNTGLINILYTGYTYDEIPDNIKYVMHIIVDGPYISAQNNGNFPASDNQMININPFYTFDLS